ncbi:MAG: DUF2786 domain-containing protein [Micromonosporaceae bacterium]
MGVRNRERRQTKAKNRQRRARARVTTGHAGHGHHGPDRTQISPADAVKAAVLFACQAYRPGVPSVEDPYVRALATVSESRDDMADLVDAALIDLVNEQLATAWRVGWQPADIARVLRRHHTGLAGMMADGCMAAHVGTFEPTTVDECFRTQLAALGADADQGAIAGFVERWMRRAGADRTTVIAAVIDLASMLARAPGLPRLCPPPGQASRAPRTRSGEGVDPKLLERVRALLAKAESSEYGAEADSYTAKAQELMVRYSIDRALLDAGAGVTEEPGGIRIGLDNPYEAEKSLLLDQVAKASRCTTVWSRHLGFVTVLGFPADLRAVELLYTSLLVQVTRAMLSEGSRRTKGGGSRTRTFRRSFLTAFAARIGERLSGVTESGIRDGAAHDSRLLPVLAGREQTVRQLAEKLFPQLTYDVRGMSWYDREGWALGTHAADVAALTAIPSVTGDHATGG